MLLTLVQRKHMAASYKSKIIVPGRKRGLQVPCAGKELHTYT